MELSFATTVASVHLIHLRVSAIVFCVLQAKLRIISGLPHLLALSVLRGPTRWLELQLARNAMLDPFQVLFLVNVLFVLLVLMPWLVKLDAPRVPREHTASLVQVCVHHVSTEAFQVQELQAVLHVLPNEPFFVYFVDSLNLDFGKS